MCKVLNKFTVFKFSEKAIIIKFNGRFLTQDQLSH